MSFFHGVMSFFHGVTRNRLNPTRLCEIHEEIHKARPSGDTAHAALRSLRGFRPLLAIMPRGNIYIRHHLTLSALYCEIGDVDNFHRHARLALEAMRRLCYVGREPFPYLEGWSYCLYVQAAYRYWELTCGASKEWLDLLEEQRGLAEDMALPDGRVPAADTRETDRVSPSGSPYIQHPAFTVVRQEGFLLIHHDPRQWWWRARINLHVDDSFGRAVREGRDWDWYSGWREKRIRLRNQLWRILPRRAELRGRVPSAVVIRDRGEIRVISV